MEPEIEVDEKKLPIFGQYLAITWKRYKRDSNQSIN